MVAKEISTRLVNRKGSWITAIDVVIDTVVLLPLRRHPSLVPIAGQPSLFCLTLKSSTIYDLAWAHLYSLMYCPLIMLNHTPCPGCSPWILAWGSHLYWQMVSPCFQAWLNHFFWKHFDSLPPASGSELTLVTFGHVIFTEDPFLYFYLCKMHNIIF